MTYLKQLFARVPALPFNRWDIIPPFIFSGCLTMVGFHMNMWQWWVLLAGYVFGRLAPRF